MLQYGLRAICSGQTAGVQRLAGDRVELVGIESHARGRPEHVRPAVVRSRVEGVATLVLLFVEGFAPAPDRHVDPVGGDDSAVVEAVVGRVLDRNVEGVALECRRLEGGHDLEGRLGQIERVLERLAQRLDLCLGRGPGQAADSHRHGVDRPTADELHDLVAGPLEPQRLLDDALVIAGHGDRALVTQEVRGVEHVDMEGVALDPFAPVEEPAQGLHLGVDLDLEKVFEGHRRAHLVGDRADAADPGDDVDYLVGSPPNDQPLEVPRRLEDRKARLADLTVGDAQLERPLAFDPRDPNDFEVVLASRGFSFGHSAPPGCCFPI